MTAKTRIFSVTGVCLALTVPFILQQQADSRQQKVIDRLRASASAQSPDLVQFEAGAGRRPSLPGNNAGAASIGVHNVTAMRAIAEESDPLKRMSLLTAFLQIMKPEEAPVFMELLAKRAKAGGFEAEAKLFLCAWGRIDGPAAMAFNLDKGYLETESAQISISGWAARNPQAALAWLDANPSEYLAVGIAQGWALKDLDAASRWAETRSLATAHNSMAEVFFKRHLEAGGIEGAKKWFENIAQDPINESYRLAVFGRISKHLAQENPSEGLQWLSDHPEKASSSQTIQMVLEARAEQDPRAAAEWALAHPDIRGKNDPDKILSSIISVWAGKEPDAAGTWLGKLIDTPDYDSATAAFAKEISGIDPQSGLAWAKTIRGQDARLRSLAEVYRQWSKSEPQAALTAMAAEGLSFAEGYDSKDLN